LTRAALLVLVLALAGCGGGGGGGGGDAGEPRFLVGAVEDASKSAPEREMKLARESGMHAIVLSAVWKRGLREPVDIGAISAAVDAVVDEGIRPVVAVYSFSSQTPLTDAEREEYAAFAASIPRRLPDVRDVIVGNEPNLNLFWMPQFDANGGDAAAVAFERLLAQTYDALKDVDEDVNVIGAALSARGSDDPNASRQTHSPTQFLLDLGAAYRASGRDRPVMDMLAIHPYGENARVPPSLAHPNSTTIGIADYGKLVRLLGRAFGGTAQPGRRLPIVYGEYGVETAIPPAKASLYTGTEPAVTVDEATQARYYTEAIGAAACQRTVRMFFVFHVTDERDLRGLQSGTRYADGSPKTSLAPVRKVADRPRCRR
jgi:hypothetical protein